MAYNPPSTNLVPGDDQHVPTANGHGIKVQDHHPSFSQDEDMSRVPTHNDLNRYATNGSIPIPQDVYEKMFLNPQTAVKGHLRKTFGNPTPLALMGFLIASTPLGCSLMGWRGADPNGAAFVGVFYFFGGLLQILGSVMEWILGNTFPFVVFGSYGAFWLAFAATLQPIYNAQAAYTSTATTTAQTTAGMQEFYATFAFFLLFMGLLTFMYLICSLRTNAIFVVIFLFLDTAFFLLAAGYWLLAEGRATLAARINVGAGACVFVFCVFGWYLLFAQLLQALDFPIELPVFDLSTKIKGLSDRRKEMEKRA